MPWLMWLDRHLDCSWSSKEAVRTKQPHCPFQCHISSSASSQLFDSLGIISAPWEKQARSLSLLSPLMWVFSPNNSKKTIDSKRKTLYFFKMSQKKSLKADLVWDVSLQAKIKHLSFLLRETFPQTERKQNYNRSRDTNCSQNHTISH